MELFVPSLVFLLAGVAVAFFVIPTIAPIMLITGSVIVLLAALYLHYSRFGVMEYERATWQYNLRKYGNWVIVGAILLGAYGFYTMNQTGSDSSAMAALPNPVASIVSSSASPALPSITMPMTGGGLGAVFKTASSRIGDLMRKGRIDV